MKIRKDFGEGEILKTAKSRSQEWIAPIVLAWTLIRTSGYDGYAEFATQRS